jgi:hypothetical protein
MSNNNAKPAPGPWTAGGGYAFKSVLKDAAGRSIASGGNNRAIQGAELEATLTLAAAAPELLAYAKCEEARSRGEDIAETVLRLHGWAPEQETAQAFIDRLRRVAIAKADGLLP